MITQPNIPMDAQALPLDIEHPEQHTIERAVTSRLQECGCDVAPELIRDEVRRALERFRDVRIRQYVAIFATRDVCAVLSAARVEGRDVSGATG